MEAREKRAKKLYEEAKTNPELLERMRASGRRHYHKNKKTIAEYSRDYTKSMREIAKELGRCMVCYKDKDNPKFAGCSKCRAYHRENYARKKKGTLNETKQNG